MTNAGNEVSNRKWSATIEAINTGVSATFAGIVTELLFYGLDSYKVVQQAGEKVKISKLYRGALPVALAGAGPSYLVFFGLYNPIRNVIDDRMGPGVESVSVLVASLVAGVPSSIVYVPADVLKKHVLLGTTTKSADGKVPSLWQTAKHLVKTEGVGRLFLGWRANLYRDVAFSAIKMTMYESLARMYLNLKTAKDENAGNSSEPVDHVVNADSLNSIEAAGVGFVSGMSTAVLTCPIDCVNSRIKSGELARFGVMSAHFEIIRKDGVAALFRGVAARSVLLGVGSTVFWYFQSSTMKFITGSEGGGHGH